VLAGKAISNPNHRIQGGGYAMSQLEMIRKEHVDGYLKVSDEDAIEMTRTLAKKREFFPEFLRVPMLPQPFSCLRENSTGKQLL